MANRSTFSIIEAKGFFIDNPPKQFQITDEQGRKLHAWKDGTAENISERLEELANNSVYQDGAYCFRTRTSTAKGAHQSTYYVIKGNGTQVQTIQESPKNKETSAIDKIGTDRLLEIISENKILKFKVETLEKTIEHLNHEIDSLEEQLEEGHHQQPGMGEGLLNALLPLGDRLLNIIESRSTAPLADIGAVAPTTARPTAIATPKITTAVPDTRSRPATVAPPPAPSGSPTAGGATPTDPASDVETITALIIERVEKDPDNPNALGQQMQALSQARPDIYEKVANLITAYYAEQ